MFKQNSHITIAFSVPSLITSEVVPLITLSAVVRYGSLFILLEVAMSTGLRFTLEVDGLPPDAFAVVSFHLNQSL
ncbi:hypothetical protein ACVUTM_22160, partial [Escherichia coli]